MQNAQTMKVVGIMIRVVVAFQNFAIGAFIAEPLFVGSMEAMNHWVSDSKADATSTDSPQQFAHATFAGECQAT